MTTDSFEAWLERELATSVDTGAPRYFGFPHGSVSAAAVRGAALLATWNPELATRHHALTASAIERRATELLGAHFYGAASHAGIVTTGASEANLAALELALVAAEPKVATRGVRALSGAPRVYVSNDVHPSVVKAARMCGLGSDAVIVVPSDDLGRMRPTELARLIGEHAARGARPLAVVATFGTTTTGSLDRVAEITEVARARGLFVHVDAAYGGLLAFAGIAREEVRALADADSVAFDPPKVFDVPLGAGLLFVRDRVRAKALLRAAFAVPARYLPRTGDEPYATTPSWSRSARLLPLVVALASRGLADVERTLRRKIALADELEAALLQSGYEVTRGSALPVMLLSDPAIERSEQARVLTMRALRAEREAGAYVPLVRRPSGDAALRAAIVSDHTRGVDVRALVEALAPRSTQA